VSTGFWWSVCGLTSDIIGASLLAVEAIKLENIRKLAERIRLQVEVPLKSPLFEPTDPNSDIWKIPGSELQAMGFGHRDWLYTAAHVVCGWVGLAIVDLLIGTVTGHNFAALSNSWILSRPVWLTLILYALVLWIVGYGIAWLVGEVLLHRVIEGSVRTILRLLGYIDRKTPTGTVGIIGFIFMFFGFVGQLMATVING
jgi:hypothetical protein